MLDNILQVGKKSGNLKGVALDYQSLKKQGETEFAMLNQMLHHLV